MRPDSLTPRMLASAMPATKTTPSTTLWFWTEGSADVMAATPAATDTATVRT